jgi:uncharacterized protein (TIGR00369 family)
MRPDAPGLDRIRSLVTDHNRVAPIARLLGARVLSVEAGRVLVEFAVKPEFMHPGKVVQGGIVTAYADVCMALAAHTLFDRGEFLSTSSITVNFLAPLTEGPVLGEGAVTRKGRSTVFLEAALRSSAGTEYARSSSVGAVRRPTPR